MKYVKTLMLLAVAAAAMMAFAGTASATLTGPAAGEEPSSLTGANSGNVSLTGPVTMTCTGSAVGGNVNGNGSNHVTITLSTLTFISCGNATITIITRGRLTFTDSGGNTAVVFSSEFKMSILVHTFFGTVHCTYATENTNIGTLTGTGHASNSNTGAKFDINGTIPIVESESDGLCFEEPATWEGTYLISSPSMLTID